MSEMSRTNGYIFIDSQRFSFLNSNSNIIIVNGLKSELLLYMAKAKGIIISPDISKNRLIGEP